MGVPWDPGTSKYPIPGSILGGATRILKVLRHAVSNQFGVTYGWNIQLIK